MSNFEKIVEALKDFVETVTEIISKTLNAFMDMLDNITDVCTITCQRCESEYIIGNGIDGDKNETFCSISCLRKVY